MGGEAVEGFGVGAFGAGAIAAGQADVAERAPVGRRRGADRGEIGELVFFGGAVVAGRRGDFRGELQHGGGGRPKERGEQAAGLGGLAPEQEDASEGGGVVELRRAEGDQFPPEALGGGELAEGFAGAREALQDRLIVGEGGREGFGEVAALGGAVVVEPEQFQVKRGGGGIGVKSGVGGEGGLRVDVFFSAERAKASWRRRSSLWVVRRRPSARAASRRTGSSASS